AIHSISPIHSSPLHFRFILFPAPPPFPFLFFFNDTPTTEIYTLSLHDALPILQDALITAQGAIGGSQAIVCAMELAFVGGSLGEIGRHTSELQSRRDLVCRLLLEKKKKKKNLSYVKIKNHKTRDMT